ncbi:Poly(A) RNA polymerase cid11 [Schizosaccharomyces japonicus yFS275]|uniref:polynucleotide adenylyltransferase n=1 Tax=Schizosaccharomyces japonicus (strain yFS275 / FY16936) TaxID=402676 RepID=B6K3R6_SCHJY|nr:Poly(A) RNA polymerase cid11 [Schizosaccharomyces japonicus yFS275]EEB08123.1 Poly(A) RNA polymerase cid11 [Schizosaccharomyces japonicus yFS275]
MQVGYPEQYICPFETYLPLRPSRFQCSTDISNIAASITEIADTVKEEVLPQDEQDFDIELQKFAASVEATEGHKQRRIALLSKLSRVLQTNFPEEDIELTTFGSTESNLALRRSDVDICIQTHSRTSKLQTTCQLARLLHEEGLVNIVCIPRARVPIVKAWDPSLGIACDINLNNSLAKTNTAMIKACVEYDARIRPMALLIKHWAKCRKFNGTKGKGVLSSYTITCMLLNYLQLTDPPILPSMVALQQNDYCKPKVQLNEKSIGSLFIGFFEYYGYRFEYESYVISVKQGYLLSKKTKVWDSDQNNILCVEEPFNNMRNLANTANEMEVMGLRLEFQRAYQILKRSRDHAGLVETFREFLTSSMDPDYLPTGECPSEQSWVVPKSIGMHPAYTGIIPEVYTMPIPKTIFTGMDFTYYIPEVRQRNGRLQYAALNSRARVLPWNMQSGQGWTVWYPGSK